MINTRYEGKYIKGSHTDSIFLHSLVLGIMEKIKIVFNSFSIGIGGGVLFPISCFGASDNLKNGNNSLVFPEKRELSYYDIKRLFMVPIAPYIKITAEYAFKPYKIDNVSISFVLGIYLNYNFGMSYDVSVLNEYAAVPPIFLEDLKTIYIVSTIIPI